ncbi:hypothetical protein [Caballeronia concitans]|uniref:hypothetical protein n=1 Tax=Caballeronia concitans TaxID=1777133 RepID=UPI000A43C5B9|nr:hypothetical protein [Caballeronia concitans]
MSPVKKRQDIRLTHRNAVAFQIALGDVKRQLAEAHALEAVHPEVIASQPDAGRDQEAQPPARASDTFDTSLISDRFSGKPPSST